MVTEAFLSSLTVARGTTATKTGEQPRAQERADSPAESVPNLDTDALETAIEDAVNNARETAETFNRSLQFSVDEISGRTVITVVDRETNEVIRQIPSEEVLALASRFGTPGGLVDTQA